MQKGSCSVTIEAKKEGCENASQARVQRGATMEVDATPDTIIGLSETTQPVERCCEATGSARNEPSHIFHNTVGKVPTRGTTAETIRAVTF